MHILRDHALSKMLRAGELDGGGPPVGFSGIRQMRAAVAHDVRPAIDLLGWWDAVKVGAGGALGAFGLWLANRTLGKAAFETAISSGFDRLTKSLQADNASLRAELATEREHSAMERAQLSGEILGLTQTIWSLEEVLRGHGIEVPQRTRRGPFGLIEIEGSSQK